MDRSEDEPPFTFQCSKIRFPTRREARHCVRNRLHGERMRAYRCEYCGMFHIGHLPDMVVEGQVTAAEFYALAKGGNVPKRGQRPIDMSEGILLPGEVAQMFRVAERTAYEWARAYQANNPDSTDVQLAAFLTPGGRWRFSAKAAREALRSNRYGN